MNDPSFCPWHVILTYVGLTKHLVAPGSPLLISLHRPFTPLTANTIGSLTSHELRTRFGVDTSIWGPHTTRGTFVDFYRKLGLPSEVVASLGQWDNLEAFGKHYLRVDASGAAKDALNDFVHKASHGSCCSSDVPQTHQEPATQVRRGGRGTEHEQQDTGEPARPIPSHSSSASKRPRVDLLLPPAKIPRLDSVSSRGRPTTRFIFDSDSDCDFGSDGGGGDVSSSS